MFLAQVPPANLLDVSIPVQARTANLSGSTKIDLLERNVATNPNIAGYGKARVRWLQHNSQNPSNPYTSSTQEFSTIVSDQNWELKGTVDFDKDGIGDLVWRNKATGDNAVWLMKNSQGTIGLSLSFLLPNAVAGWEIKGIADFDKDGKQNILWQNSTTGETAVWGVNYTAANLSTNPFSLDPNKTKTLTNFSPGWEMMGWVDMNKNNIADIVWQNKTTGETAIWELKSDVTVDKAYLGTNVGANSGWSIEGVADMNNDTVNDIVWRNNSTNDTAVWQMKIQNGQTVLDNGYLLADKPTNSNWQLLAVTDTNNDGVPDFIWSNYLTAENAIWEMKVANGIASLKTGYVTSHSVGFFWRFSAIAQP